MTALPAPRATKRFRWEDATAGLVLTFGLAACAPLGTAPPSADAVSSPSRTAQLPSIPPAAATSDVAEVRLITPQTPAIRAYRKIGAGQIYKLYPKRIYKGKIPPLVYAVVVVETDIDAMGKVVGVSFSRIPSHAPEVPPLIEALIQQASPLPSPGALGAHTYIDSWLWDKSGNFQLDSRTLGQRSR